MAQSGKSVRLGAERTPVQIRPPRLIDRLVYLEVMPLASKAVKVAGLVQRLRNADEETRTALLRELSDLYPGIKFFWESTKGGLCIHLPASTRLPLPAALNHAAAIITQSVSDSEYKFLKSRPGIVEVNPAATPQKPPLKKLPRTAYERLLGQDDFD